MATILLADDNDSVRATLRRLLEHVGHTVHEARNGKEALRLAKAAVPELVITDMLMPEADGIEVLGELRREVPDVPVIAVSGGGMIDAQEFLRMAEHLGAARVLRKPIEAADLYDAVDSVLGGDA